MARQPIILEAERDFPLPQATLWDLLANTDHLNRSIGMPHVAFGPIAVTADAFYREAGARFFGLVSARWREYPFEWVRDERYAVLRLFESGFLDTFYAGVELRPRGEETAVRILAELTPRGRLSWWIAWLMGRKGVRETLAYCERFVELRASGADLVLPPAPERSSVNHALLDRLLADLGAAGIGEDLVARFGRHLASASDREVLLMQPFGLADGWGAERGDVLRLLVQAERLGGLSHTWEVMCPNCRLPKASAPTTADLPERFHCDACGIAYDTDLARFVELRYSVRAPLRPAKDETYCIGGPANTPHVWVQQYLLPATERVVSARLADEPFRARALRVNHVCPLDPDPGTAGEVTLAYRQDGWYQMRQRFRPGRVQIRLRNETDRVVVAVIEQERWDPRAITAAQVLGLPEFREVAAMDGSRPPGQPRPGPNSA